MFLLVLLLLTLVLTWLIYRSNSSHGRPGTTFATVSGVASDSVGRFFSGLMSRTSGGARSPQHLGDMMELKGIILSRRRPVAMINTTAFEQGETAPMQLASREYSIHCMDISPNKVLVKADESEMITLELKVRLQ
jgi:hypothetical protein